MEVADSVASLEVLQSDVHIDILVIHVVLSGGMNGCQVADATRVSRPVLKVMFIAGYAKNALVGKGREMRRGPSWPRLPSAS